MATVIDLSTLGTDAGFILQGDDPGDLAGFSVASAGDVNGDGFDDFVVGAIWGDDGGSSAGEAYVIFGRAGGFGTIDGTDRRVIDLTSLAPADGFIIQGDAAYDYAGCSVSSAGDVNGDGFDDFIVGAVFGSHGVTTKAGEAYVVFGRAGGFGTIDPVTNRQVLDLTSLAPADGFIIQGDAAYDYAGSSVSSAGDVNGDGFDDIIVGAPSGGNHFDGEAYVVFGRAGGFGTVDGTGRSVIDLTSLAPADGFIIQGDASGDRAGSSVSSAGDVNGDGFDDIIVGAWRGGDGLPRAGEAYVVFGRTGGFGTIDGTGRSVLDLTSLAPADGFIVQGDLLYDYAGRSVSSAGDVNGDGFDDLIVGAYGGDDGGSFAGEAYVVFGRAGAFGTVDGTGRRVIDLTTLSTADGFIIQGDAAGDNAGYSVSAAGDVNGDGFDDFIVGARRGNDGGTDAGEVYVIFGRAGSFGTVDGTGRRVIDLTSLAPADGFIIQGDDADDEAGRSVASAGDVNGDGFDDLMVGSPYGDNGGTDAGEAYVIFGAAPTMSVTRIGSAIGQTIRGGAFDDTLDGREGDDQLFGAGGADTLFGYNGNDSLFGGAAADQLAGGEGNDSLFGQDGNDRLDGDFGADALDGGAGKDTADYAGEYGGVWIDLTTGIGRWNSAQGDTLSMIENVIGTDWTDWLTGSSDNNRLDGGKAADRLLGNAGNDVLVGGLGADVLDGGANVDTADYSGNYGGVWINFITGAGKWNYAEGDTLSGIEKVIGTSFADTFESNNVTNVFTGGLGNDTFVFRPGFSQDIITDFDGNGAAAGDTIRFRTGIFTGYGDMLAHASQQGADVRIQVDAANFLVLQNTQLADLHSSDFIFG